MANFIRPFPKLVEDEEEDGGGSWELRVGECVGGKGGVDWERAQSGMAKVVGEDDSEARETQEAFVDALFSFGGGIGGECFEEPAANLKTLREAKREDDEVDCFCPDPELLVVAIEDGRGRPDVPTEVSGGGRVLHGKVLVPSDGLWLRIRANTHKSRFGFVWTLWRDIKSFPRQQTETERGLHVGGHLELFSRRCFGQDVYTLVTSFHFATLVLVFTASVSFSCNSRNPLVFASPFRYATLSWFTWT